jgi:hypothetical protein
MLSWGNGTCTKEASMSTLMPQAMEKKEAMEGSAFMRKEASKAHYTKGRTLRAL